MDMHVFSNLIGGSEIIAIYMFVCVYGKLLHKSLLQP